MRRDAPSWHIYFLPASPIDVASRVFGLDYSVNVMYHHVLVADTNEARRCYIKALGFSARFGSSGWYINALGPGGHYIEPTPG